MEILFQKAKAAVEMSKANLLQTEVAGNRANREYDRLLKLKEVGLVTQQNLDDGLTEKEASAAKSEAAKAQLRAVEEDLRHTQTRLSIRPSMGWSRSGVSMWEIWSERWVRKRSCLKSLIPASWT
jgi:multidrug efflux pump subunit AcrA (membrane-fusion protein)